MNEANADELLKHFERIRKEQEASNDPVIDVNDYRSGVRELLKDFASKGYSLDMALMAITAGFEESDSDNTTKSKFVLTFMQQIVREEWQSVEVKQKEEPLPPLCMCALCRIKRWCFGV